MNSQSEHWLTFDTKRRVTGCHCGYIAKEDDAGFGDSVVKHLLFAGAAEAQAQAQLWQHLSYGLLFVALLCIWGLGWAVGK